MSNPFEGRRVQGDLNRMAGGPNGADPPSERSDLPRDEKEVAPRASGELDDEFVARQNARLEEMMRVLLRARSEIEEEEKGWDESVRYARPHAEDVSAHLLSDEVDTAIDRRLTHRLGLVERALKKIDVGTHGICDATGEPIPKGRLEAVPEAIYTLQAQKRLEGSM